MEFIKGEDREQAILFPESIDDYVDEDSAVRVIDAFINSLDLSKLGFVRHEPNETGRPPYDPKDILKLYVYGYMNRIRSSRRLETESKRNLEVIWLLQKLTPDHKTISNFRKVNKKALKNVFRSFVKLCIELDLYGRELAAIDGSKFKAVNSKDRNFTKGKLKDRLERIDLKIEEYLRELENAGLEEDSVEKEKTVAEINKIVKNLKERKTEYQAIEKELEETGETQKSLTDPESRLMLANGKMEVCYNVQTVVDAKHKLIAEFEVTNNANDMNQLTPMTEKTMEILETEKIAVTADKGYNSASDIAQSVLMGVQAHVAGADIEICIPAEENGQAPDPASEITAHENGKCVYLKDRNIALCPAGKTLHPQFYKKTKRLAVFFNNAACKECVCRCTNEARAFRYEFTMEESGFTKECNDKDLNVKQVKIKGKNEIISQRKCIVEHPFGTIKRSMDAGYCLLKGKVKVTAEFSLVFLAYNIKRVINIMGSKKLIEAISNRACTA
jgi:transposase